MKKLSVASRASNQVGANPLGGPVNPPGSPGSYAPDHFSGPVNPPSSAMNLIVTYQANTGLGTALHALDRLNYTTYVKATRYADRASIAEALRKESVQVERLKWLGTAQRGLLARAPLLTRMSVERVDAKNCELLLGVDRLAIAYPQTQARTAVDQMVQGMNLGEVHLPLIVAEAENPAWLGVSTC